MTATTILLPPSPRVLVARLSSMGDVLMTTPVLRWLHLQLGAGVTFVTQPAFASLLRHNPHVQQVIEMRKGEAWTGGPELFDLFVDLHQNRHTAKLRKHVPHTNHIGFDKANLAKWMMVNLKDGSSVPHLVQRYAAALSPIGVLDDDLGLVMHLPSPPGDMEVFGIYPTLPYLAVAVGAAHRTKVMDSQVVAAAIKALGVPVVLLGGLGEEAFADEMLAKLGVNYPATNLVGKLALDRTAQVVSKAAAMLAPDTGLMHMAVALGIPVVSVWGSTVPQFGMWPWFAKGNHAEARSSVVELAGLACRPCGKIGHTHCPLGHHGCMAWLDAGVLAQALRKALGM